MAEEAYETQLAQMLGDARTSKDPVPSELSSIVPNSFERAGKARVEKFFEANPDFGGDYDAKSNTIRINDLDRFIRMAQKQGVKLKPQKDPTHKIYLPAVLPHEAGHAIFNELLNRVFDRDDPKSMDAVNTVHQWGDLHNKVLKGNKALGAYQYADDPKHSFADAFAARIVDPNKFKNLFPELDSFFSTLSDKKKSK